VHRQAYIQERGLHADLPVTDAAAARTLALPVFAALADAERDRVVDGLRAAVGRHGGLTERPGSRANGHAGRTAGAATPEVASQPR
jgi:hypothetical protein